MSETVEARKDIVTIKSAVAAARKLNDAGALKGLSRHEKAVVILDQCVQDNPTAFADPSIDWDALIAFIERLIPLIMTIISLF
jgi:aspartate/tyrosine/aromatic aminotransferase